MLTEALGPAFKAAAMCKETCSREAGIMQLVAVLALKFSGVQLDLDLVEVDYPFHSAVDKCDFGACIAHCLPSGRQARQSSQIGKNGQSPACLFIGLIDGEAVFQQGILEAVQEFVDVGVRGPLEPAMVGIGTKGRTRQRTRIYLRSSVHRGFMTWDMTVAFAQKR
jgi:hypothetical protein